MAIQLGEIVHQGTKLSPDASAPPLMYTIINC
jgi:hypothetical protein